jgi:hypothetical protein
MGQADAVTCYNVRATCHAEGFLFDKSIRNKGNYIYSLRYISLSPQNPHFPFVFLEIKYRAV